MKVFTLLPVAFCFCFVLADGAGPQRQHGKRSPADSASRTKQYAEGGVYTINERINLGIGNTMRVTRIPNGPGPSSAIIAVRIAFSGKAQSTAFAQSADPEQSVFSLVVGPQRLNPSSYNYLDDFVSCTTVASYMSFEQKDGRRGQLGTTCRPLGLVFKVPDELLRETKTLEIRKFEILMEKGNKPISLKVRLNQ